MYWLYPDLVHNLANLWFKAHVKHAVCFIQNQVCAASQVGLSSLEEVDQTTRCGNADLNTYVLVGYIIDSIHTILFNPL